MRGLFIDRFPAQVNAATIACFLLWIVSCSGLSISECDDTLTAMPDQIDIGVLFLSRNDWTVLTVARGPGASVEHNRRTWKHAGE